MKKRSFVPLFILVGAAITILTSGPILAQSYEVAWWKVAGGGGSSTANKYTLSGTIAQAEAGSLTGGNYTLLGGFWGITMQQYIHLPLILRN